MTTTMRHGYRVATVDYALAQAIPEMARENAVSVLDSALHLNKLDRAGLRRVRRLVRGRRGAKRTHPWWSLVDPRAESPLETRARLIYHDAGLAPHTLQLPLLGSRGDIVGYGDLAWRRRHGGWVVVEMDGPEYHSGPEALFRDRARQNEAVATGRVTMIRFTGQDLWHPSHMVDTVRDLLDIQPLVA